MADCANCGAPNSPECENCTQCGKPVGGRKSTNDGQQTGTKTVFSTGHLGSYGPAGNWSIPSPAGTYSPYYPTQVSTTGGATADDSRPTVIGFQTKPPSVYVIPQIEIPVANTNDYGSETSSNTSLYTPATAAEIGNGAVDYVKFAEKMQADANQLAADLTALKNAKGVSGGGAGGSVPDGPDCDTDVDYPANTFHIEAKTKFEVVPCEDETIIELYNGTIRLTIEGGNLTIAGATTVNVVDGQLQEGGVRVATRGWVTDNFSENDHTHTFSGSGSDGNTSITISGTTSGPST
jgi:hypothetical protein